MEGTKAPRPALWPSRGGRLPATGVLLVAALVAAPMAEVVAPAPTTPAPDTPDLDLASEHGAGALDPTFDGDGIAITDLSSSVRAADAAVQDLGEDGERILVLTSVDDVYRFHPDGRLDTTFDDDGVLPLDRLVPDLNARRLSGSPQDGQFVVGGEVSAADQTWGVARFDLDGSVDTSFGDEGLVTLTADDFTEPDELGDFADVGVQSTGTVVAVGTGVCIDIPDPCGDAVQAARLAEPDGGVLATADTPVGGFELEAASLAMNDDVVVVSANVGDDDLVGAVAYTNTLADEVRFDFQPYDASNEPLPVVVRGDGVVAVAAAEVGEDAWDLLRWQQDGSFLGRTESPLPSDVLAEVIGDVNLTQDDGFVLAGRLDVGALDTVGLARYGPDGDLLDIVSVEHPGPPPVDLFPERLSILADGSLRVVGEALPSVAGLSPRLLMVARLLPDGTFDDLFGPDGNGFALHRGNSADLGRAVAVRPDHRIVDAGAIPDTGRESSAGFVLQHDEGGPLDSAFSPALFPPGSEITRYSTAVDGPTTEIVVEGMTLDATGRIVLVGRGGGTSERDLGMIHRLEPAGGSDPEFNPSAGDNPVGRPVQLDLGDANTLFHDVMVDDAGRIVVVGQTQISTDPVVDEIVVVRLEENGEPDSGFGSDADEPGIVRMTPLDTGETNWDAEGMAVALDDAGRIVVTGTSQAEPGSSDAHLFVARLTEDGSLDDTFGDLESPYGPGVRLGPLDHRGRDVITHDDSVLVAGTRQDDIFEPAFVLDRGGFVAQFTEDGEFDPAFGTNGIAFPFDATDTGNSVARGLAVDAVGNVVAVGGSLEQTSTSPPQVDPRDVLVARLLSTGELDESFGEDGNGLVTTDVGLDTDLDLVAGEQARDVAIDPDGRIVTVGSVLDDRSRRVLTARYNPGITTLVCDPDPVDVGGVEVGTSNTTAVTCTATGGTTVITDVAIDTTSAHADDYAVDPGTCADATLFPEQSCTLGITFTPSTDGDRTADLALAHTTVTGTPTTVVPLQGRGTGEPGFAAEPDPATFTGLFGTPSPPQTITVTNLGNLPMTITDMTVVGPREDDFSVAETTCPGTTLAPEATCTVDVVFLATPGPELTRNARVRFDDDAPGAPHFVGLEGSIAGPSIELDPTEGPIETEVEASGIGFEPGTPVDVRIDDVVLGTVPADEVTGGTIEGGTFTTTVVLPEGIPGGEQTVRACQGCDTPSQVEATAAFEVTPRLFLLPTVSRPGGVVSADGDGYPANTPITLNWDRGLGTTVVMADESGEFTVPVLVFRKDQLGVRELQATISGGEEVVAATPLLAVPGSSQPRDFSFRR